MRFANPFYVLFFDTRAVAAEKSVFRVVLLFLPIHFLFRAHHQRFEPNALVVVTRADGTRKILRLNMLAQLPHFSFRLLFAQIGQEQYEFVAARAENINIRKDVGQNFRGFDEIFISQIVPQRIVGLF